MSLNSPPDTASRTVVRMARMSSVTSDARRPARSATRCLKSSKPKSSLYRGRAAVEREVGRLKNEWSLLPLRVRGSSGVRVHADLTILAKVACALSRARAVPLTA